MIVATGVDILEIARIERLLERGAERFFARVFTTAELEYCRGKVRPAVSFAARFCAKEAVLKCLQTGWGQGLGFAQIEVVRAASGAVGVRLHGAAAARAAAMQIATIHLTLSHSEHVAIAFAVAER